MLTQIETLYVTQTDRRRRERSHHSSKVDKIQNMRLVGQSQFFTQMALSRLMAV